MILWEKGFYLPQQVRDISAHCIPHFYSINDIIAMNETIPHSGNQLPWNMWMLSTKLARKTFHRFSDHKYLIQSCRLCSLIINEFFKCHIFGESNDQAGRMNNI